jgi:hypothetical protein
MLATASLVFVLLLAIYRATIMPTVVDQDSGELVAAVHVLGIAHPTGYPLWVLLGRLLDYLPLGGTTAYRVAMLSAVCAAAAGGIITALAAGLVGDLAPAALAGLAFGLWFPTWSQAVRAEVYGLTALLTALSLVALLRWNGSRAPRGLAWLALACGFVSMHHRTAMLAVLPALAIAVIMTKPRRARLYLVAGALLVAPFLCYAYLPIRAAARPPVNWTNPSTLPRFLDHVMGTQYTHFAFSHSVEQMIAQAAKLTPELLAAAAPLAWALALVGLPLIGWGWWRWAKAQPLVAWALGAGSALLCFWVLQWGETSDLKVFFQPLGQVLALCGAMGVVALARSARNTQAGRMGAAALGGVICIALLGANWKRSDLSNLWAHRDRWAAVLQQLEPKAVYVSDNDVPSFATMYLQTVEGMRKDVTLIRVVPLQTDWYVDLIADPVVREATRKAWRETELGMSQIEGQGSFGWNWDRTAVFAYLLARELQGHRPVYSLHGPQRGAPPGPPYFVSLSEDLVALAPGVPITAPQSVPGAGLADFALGIRLLYFEWEQTQAEAGALAGFRTVWEAGGMVRPVQFGLRLQPASMAPEVFERKLLPKGRFVQGFPLLYGRWELPMVSSSAAHEQRGQAVVPSNAPAGEYRVMVAVGPPYTEVYTGWAEVGRLQVKARPLPRNGP